ncbi:hypothetical protein LEP1GSC036_2192 [Leptospira weilii str. 2006001853]|uniref:Uncharacterized protein n=1 Tax=Leptospira weilii str. 2006001853 TaxID=1001589 RepID=A0A828YZF2_9LEPT|nr:hypothetical protein LEP1GSC036_3784 [Leptospira weilii str. 2006001853]EKR63391.1 hypothetical protein LEP1GSC036_2192 [Leptospira weilii str. 2006001853]EMJ60644.1 hypothetical protein LEP1GSC051_4536 [Leptospira sp. P2653]EMN43726.1 hypothetical protein LEP1GSC086_4481 [Leptospira weilii str. LNT 1234]
MLPILFFFSFLSDFGDSSFCLSGIQKAVRDPDFKGTKFGLKKHGAFSVRILPILT